MRAVNRRDAVTITAAAGFGLVAAAFPTAASEAEGEKSPADRSEYIFYPSANNTVVDSHKVPFKGTNATRAEFALDSSRGFYVAVGGSATAQAAGIAGVKVSMDVGIVEDVQFYASAKTRVVLIPRLQSFKSNGSRQHWIEVTVNSNTVIDEHDRIYVTVLPR
jgi:hypothetical protein